MKLLFDENISYRLVRRIADLFPDSEQVKRLGLLAKKDPLVWAYARQHGFTIVTFDEDYAELSTLRGFPPKVVWLRTGNLTTPEIADLLRRRFVQIEEFVANNELGCLELY